MLQSLSRFRRTPKGSGSIRPVVQSVGPKFARGAKRNDDARTKRSWCVRFIPSRWTKSVRRLMRKSKRDTRTKICVRERKRKRKRKAKEKERESRSSDRSRRLDGDTVNLERCMRGHTESRVSTSWLAREPRVVASETRHPASACVTCLLARSFVRLSVRTYARTSVARVSTCPPFPK